MKIIVLYTPPFKSSQNPEPDPNHITSQPTTTTTAHATNNSIQHTKKMNPATDKSTIYISNLSDSNLQLLKITTNLNNVSSSRELKAGIMPEGYMPSDSDVCCGRGKQNWTLAGNIYFRKLIRASLARYMAASSKKEKTAVILSVVDKIRQRGGHFLMKQQQQPQHGSSYCYYWYNIGSAAARTKVGHSLRDRLANVARSGNVTKSSALRQAKERARRCAADAASDCESVKSALISTSSWWI
jgi:hypothetical protein